MKPHHKSFLHKGEGETWPIPAKCPRNRKPKCVAAPLRRTGSGREVMVPSSALTPGHTPASGGAPVQNQAGLGDSAHELSPRRFLRQLSSPDRFELSLPMATPVASGEGGERGAAKGAAGRGSALSGRQLHKAHQASYSCSHSITRNGAARRVSPRCAGRQQRFGGHATLPTSAARPQARDSRVSGA